jgi:hypothetical protein
MTVHTCVCIQSTFWFILVSKGCGSCAACCTGCKVLQLTNPDLEEVSSKAAAPWLLAPPPSDLAANLAAAATSCPSDTVPQPGALPTAGPAGTPATTVGSTAMAEGPGGVEGEPPAGVLSKGAAAVLVPPVPLGGLEQQLAALLGQPHNYEGFPPEPQRHLSIGSVGFSITADAAAGPTKAPSKRQTDGGAANSVHSSGRRASAVGVPGPAVVSSNSASRRQSNGASNSGLPEQAWKDLLAATQVS